MEIRQRTAVRRGDRIRAAGTVVEVERGGGQQTTLRATAIEVLGRGAVAATVLDGPPAQESDWERYEGMWLRINCR